MQSLRHIVVGTDFSRCAESALECAVTLANLGLAKVTIVHVCELEVASSGVDEQQLDACAEKLAALVARYTHCGVEVKTLLRAGKPWEKLGNAATEVGASLIVIGRVGASVDHHGPTEHAPLGAVAQHVLRCATRPVVVVPVSDPVLPRTHA